MFENDLIEKFTQFLQVVYCDIKDSFIDYSKKRPFIKFVVDDFEKTVDFINITVN